MKPYNTGGSKKDEVRAMFDNIAPKYDKLNHTLSLNIDKLWRRRVVRIVERMQPHRILDLATGTGDLAIAMATRIKNCQVLGVDISEKMLDAARVKVSAHGLDERIVLDQGDAEKLGVASDSIDVATVAFGVRNFGDIDTGIKEIYRTIKRGGCIVVLEFSTPRNPIVGWGYRLYSHKVLPLIGGAVSKDKRAYEYLPSSVDEFPSPERFVGILQAAGFKNCRQRSLSMGIAYIYIGEK